jgi:hypothetical protein
MQQIIHNIPLIGQEKENQSFFASVAMVLSWKSGEHQDISSVVDSASQKKFGLGLSDAGQSIEALGGYLKDKGMTIIEPLSLKIDELSLIIFQSPLLAIFLSNDNLKVVYALVITGLTGDGTLTNTFIYIQDPDLKSKGIKYKIALGDFYQQFLKAVEANNNINLEKTTPKFWYYNASPTLNVTSTHHSFSSSSKSTETSFDTNYNGDN